MHPRAALAWCRIPLVILMAKNTNGLASDELVRLMERINEQRFNRIA